MTSKRIGLFLVFVLLAACACTRSNRTTPATVPVAGIDSGILLANSAETAGGQWIENKEQFTTFSRQYLAKTSIPGKGTSIFDTIDSNNQYVMVVWMGVKPTGGYAMALASNEAPVDNGTARVSAKWIGPDDNAITPQVVTNPYLIVVLGQGPYDTIAIVDQTGAVRVTVALTK